MSIPYDVTYRGMWPSDAVNACVRERAGELYRLGLGDTWCRVVLDRSSPRGNLEVIVAAGAAGRRATALRTLGARATQERICEALVAAFSSVRVELYESARVAA